MGEEEEEKKEEEERMEVGRERKEVVQRGRGRGRGERRRAAKIPSRFRLFFSCFWSEKKGEKRG